MSGGYGRLVLKDKIWAWWPFSVEKCAKSMRFPLDVFIVDLTCYFWGSVVILMIAGYECWPHLRQSRRLWSHRACSLRSAAQTVSGCSGSSMSLLSAPAVCCAAHCSANSGGNVGCVRLASVAIVSGACGFDPRKLQYHLRRIDHDPPGVRVLLDDPGDSSLARATGEAARWQWSTYVVRPSAYL